VNLNIFCLSTGRCGSTTFSESFAHAENYTSGHETHARVLGTEHFVYPDNHIESDNRLSWMLGSLEKYYGDDPIYVHLYRNKDEVVRSYSRRYSPSFRGGIMHGFGHGILARKNFYDPESIVKVAEMYVDVVTSNIESFLKNKTKVVKFDLANPEEPVHKIWEMGKMEGDLQKAIQEWSNKHNQSAS
jgi:hypothetical protein